MGKNVQHVQHVKSNVVENGSPKLPTPSVLAEGEIAINFAEGYETLSIKSSSGNIKTFSSDEYYTEQKLGSGFTSANSGRTVTDVIVENEEIISSALTDLDDRKLDASAYTPTDLSNYYTKDETSGKTELSNAFAQKLNINNFNTYSGAVNTALGNKANTSDLDNFFDDVKYEDSGTTKVINFYHGNAIKATIDASDFIVDGMVDDVRIENGNLIIDFNTASGKQDISIPLTDIFDPSNYYNKTAIDSLVGSGFTSSSITDVIIENEEIVSNALTDLDERKLDASAYTPTDLSNYYTKSETSGATQISNALGAKVDSAAYNTHTGDTTIHFTTGTVQTQIDNSISGKVNISDVISAITPSNSGSTNPIATKVIAENELTVSNALIDLDERKLDASAYTPTDLSDYYTKSETSGATELSTALGNKLNTSDFNTYSGSVDTALSGKIDTNDVDQTIDSTTSASTNPVATSAVYDFLTAYTPSITVDQVLDNTTSASTNAVSTSAVYRCINDNELVVSTAVNNLEENKADREEDLDGIKLKKITQSDYDALVQAGTVDPNTLYIITD